MLSFLDMMNDYDDRKVARDEYGWGFISTVFVIAGRKDYETAVKHPDYNDGDMVIVDCYATEKEAKRGHQKWIKIMENPPDQLKDCANSEIA